jgi:hypothetical protein
MSRLVKSPRAAKSVFKDFYPGRLYLIYKVNPHIGRLLLEDFAKTFHDGYMTVKPRWEDAHDNIRLITYDHPEKGRAAIMYDYSRSEAVVQLILDLNGPLPELLCKDWRAYRIVRQGRKLHPNADTPWGVVYTEQISHPTVPDERSEERATHDRSLWALIVRYFKGKFS